MNLVIKELLTIVLFKYYLEISYLKDIECLIFHSEIFILHNIYISKCITLIPKYFKTI